MSEKQIAAEKAVDFIEAGMVVGLGTGSTVSYLVKKLAQKVEEGLKITAVSTSIATTKLAESLGIHILNFDDVDEIDLTIDGADEVDINLNGIKGGKVNPALFFFPGGAPHLYLARLQSPALRHLPHQCFEEQNHVLIRFAQSLGQLFGNGPGYQKAKPGVLLT